MSVQRTEQQDNTNFSTRSTRSLFYDAQDAIEKCPDSNLKRFFLDGIRFNRLGTTNNRLSTIEEIIPFINKIGNKIVNELQSGNTLTDIHKAGIQLLISLLMNDDRGVLINVQISLESILDNLEGKREDYEWFYNTLLQNLTQSQQDKLKRAFVPELLDLPLVEQPNNEVSKPKLIIKKISKYFVPDHDQIPREDFNTRMQSKFVIRLIELFASTSYNKSVSESSAGFLGLDRAGKEAVCWQQLELSRSNNEDLSRLAGAIAWKVWLLKNPLLKKYCLDNGIEFNDLSFSKRAELTKKAVETYSEEERTSILDQAVEKELERRKKRFQPETRPEFKGKRVSIGVELEIIYPPFDLGVIYAWYENLDRSSVGETMVYEKEVNEQFSRLAVVRDLQELYRKVSHISQKADELVKKVDSTNREETDRDVLRSRVQELIDLIPNQEFKVKLISKSEGLELGIIDPNILKSISNYWKSVLYMIDLKRLKAKEQFDSLIETKLGEEEYEKKSFYGLRQKISRDAKIMLDFFLHQMGQAQSLGHKFSYDAYGEHALDYVSGDHHDPYGLLSREIWELAHSLFHDFEFDERPMHITIGWKERFERGLKISELDVTTECSILNFALIVSGLGNRKFIQDFHEKNLLAISEGREGADVLDYYENGRSTFIRYRGFQPKSVDSIEFRGFAPSKNDFPKLASKLGNLGTAMIAWFAVQEPGGYDQVDSKLAEIWTNFRERIEAEYNKYYQFPPLFEANYWMWQSNLPKITNLYREISNTLYVEDGLMNTVAKIVTDAERQVIAVFKEVPPPGIEPGVAA